MGKQSRAKRARREQAGYAAGLTACEGTWLERPPDAEEVARIKSADQMLRGFRLEAQNLAANRDALNMFSLQIYREERWTPLHLDDWVIESILDDIGEPPIVANNDDPAFSDYLLRALGGIASARVRRTLAEQSRRFLPLYVGEAKFREALAIEHNAYLTVMSDAATPLLVQMLVGGLARWYEEHEEESEETPAPQGEATPEQA
jgi:hypothetical protein